jgi:pimeloyl-ACP methyl ester carboxylesterase
MGHYRFAGGDGVELAYRDAGTGRPLILLHGFMGDGSHMLEHGPARAFPEQGYRPAPDHSPDACRDRRSR